MTATRLWIALVLLAGIVVPLPALALPSFEEVKAAYTPSEAWLLARDGRPLQSLRVDLQIRRFPWTRLEEVSTALCRAVIISEDKRFYEHHGVDWTAAGNAAWDNFWNTRTRGASTMTMQLVGLLEEDGKRHGRRSLLEKISQTAAALQLEKSWSKKQILESYLNLVNFRGEYQGIAAMSQNLFGKWPDGLNEQESALAAVQIRSPNSSLQVITKRACTLLTEMGRKSECTNLSTLAYLALTGNLRHDEISPSLAPHLAHKLLTIPGQQFKSSLDGDLQSLATESLHRHLADLTKQNVHDGAVLVLDNASGEVLAWVGSSGDLSAASEVDGVTALRQVGSTLKPFLYALAFENRSLTPASLIEDAPLTLETGNGLYLPQNYEPQYQGWVSARMALAGSLNVPAVKTLVRLGPDTFLQRLHLLGFDCLKKEGDWYGFSLALGSADVSVLILANAYRTLANGGRWSPLRVTRDKAPSPVPCKQEGCIGVFTGPDHTAFIPEATFLVANILSDPSARAGTFGLESWLATPYWTAVKTGTSKDMRDNWCAGFSQHYTVVVWVGNAAGEPMHNVSGISGAAPVWREVMDWLHRGAPTLARPKNSSQPPDPPLGIVKKAISFEPPKEPSRQEWFLAGTEREVIIAAGNHSLARIDYPADGAILALDPDIPPQRQRLALQLSAPAGPGWQWCMDNKPLGRVDRNLLWLPQPGHHRLTLADGKGKEIDAVEFEVRALSGKSDTVTPDNVD